MIDAINIEKDFLVMTAAFTGVVLFYLIRSIKNPPVLAKGQTQNRDHTRISSLANLSHPANSQPHKPTELRMVLEKWQGNIQHEFSAGFLAADNVVWEVGLFSARRVAHQFTPQSTQPGATEPATVTAGAHFNLLAESRKDAESILAPLVKKIVTKTRMGFGHRVTINMEREVCEKPLYSVLKNDAALHQMAIVFIDECTQIAQMIEVTPLVTLTWTDVFCLTLNWPALPSLEILTELAQAHREISVRKERNQILLTLTLAFTEEKSPTKNLELQELSELKPPLHKSA